MKCIICGKTDNRMLVRTKPTGQPDGGWAHITCVEQTEPELAKNIKEDFGQFEKDVYDGKFKPDFST